MQGPTCTSCRVVSRSRFYFRLFSLKDNRRRYHTSPSKHPDATFIPQSWYWESQPPSKANLSAAARFFGTHRPFQEWVGTGWRRHSRPTPGGLLLPEIIILGRSNVGKSSLLNRLTYSTNELNRVSSTPGATKTMWAWSLAAKNESGGAIPGWGGDCSSKLTIVDLPGYGYGSDADWGNEIVTYMKNRKELRRAYVIVDALQGITPHDHKIFAVLRSLSIPYQIIVSKCDKSGWHGSQTAVESALRPIREEAELGSGTHAGLGEILLVGGLQNQSPIKPYGIKHVQWSMLRATGLDKHAMSGGPSPGTIAEYSMPKLGQYSSSQVQQPLSTPAVPPPKKPELSLQDFLAELLNVKSPPRNNGKSSSTTQPPPASPATKNPVDRKLMDLIAASRSPSPSAPSSAFPSSTQVGGHAASRHREVSSPPPPIRYLNGRDTEATFVVAKKPAAATAAKAQAAKANIKTITPAVPQGRGVSYGLEAFESMFAADQPKAKNGSKSKSKPNSKSSRAAADAPLPPRNPAAQVSAGKGVTQGLDAFQSMFGADQSGSGGGGKNKKSQKRRA